MKIHGVHIVSLLGHRATILKYCILFYMRVLYWQRPLKPYEMFYPGFLILAFLCIPIPSVRMDIGERSEIHTHT